MKQKPKAASRTKSSAKSQESSKVPFVQKKYPEPENVLPEPDSVKPKYGIGKDIINVGIITVVIFLIIMVVSAYVLGPQIKEQSQIYIKEELLKKANMTLNSGEIYVYEYSAGNESNNLTYQLSGSAGCIKIDVLEVSGTGVSCVKKDGTDMGGSNVTLSDPMVFLFRPWMLAIEKGWSWKFGMYSNITGANEINGYTIYEKGEIDYHGRNAYLIGIKDSQGSERVTMIVDREKRVLLEEEGNEYKIRILSAPFPLTQ